MKREEFFRYGFTADCPGCQAIIKGHTTRGHAEDCRNEGPRSEEGRERKHKQEVKENEWLADQVKRRALSTPHGEKRGGEDDGDDRSEKRVKTIINRGTKRHFEDTTEVTEMDGHGPSQQGEASSSSGLNELVEESPMQEDMLWEINYVDDTCEPSVEPAVYDYFDEQTLERLDPVLVRVGEEEEMKRFQENGCVLVR